MKTTRKNAENDAVGRALAEICSALEYLVDRGEVSTIQEVLTNIRWQKRDGTYTRAKSLPSFDVVVAGRKVRITAQDIGAAEEEEKQEGPGMEVKLINAADLGLTLRQRRRK